MQRRLEGKVALVTGGGVRLGRAIAEGLGREGATVAVHYHASSEGADAAVAAIRASGARAEVFQADLSRTDSVRPLVENVERALGPVTR